MRDELLNGKRPDADARLMAAVASCEDAVDPRSAPGGVPVSVPSVPGMTLRDWFAGQAMAGMLSSSEECYGGYYDYAALSEEAYEAADAMLAARGGGK